MGNNESKIYFWDFQSLEEYSEEETDEPTPQPQPQPLRRAVSRSKSTRINRHASVASSSHLDDSTDESGRLSKAAQKYSIRDPFRPLLAHSEMTIPKVTFAARQVAWSVGGEWMVVVGDQGMIAIFGR